jgi:hypothetical protein
MCSVLLMEAVKHLVANVLTSILVMNQLLIGVQEQVSAVSLKTSVQPRSPALLIGLSVKTILVIKLFLNVQRL